MKRVVIRLRKHRLGIGTYDLWYEGRVHMALQGWTHAFDAELNCAERFETAEDAAAEIKKEGLTKYGNVSICECTMIVKDVLASPQENNGG